MGNVFVLVGWNDFRQLLAVVTGWPPGVVHIPAQVLLHALGIQRIHVRERCFSGPHKWL
jgi:hypothetical protein